MAIKLDDFEAQDKRAAAAAEAEMVALIRKAALAAERAVKPAPEVAAIPAWQAMRSVNSSGPGRKRFDHTRLSLPMALLAVALVLPAWVVGTFALVTLALLTAAAWSMGTAGIRRLVIARHAALRARDPARAEAVRARAARVSARLERWLSYLPARWTQGLYLPDFEPEETGAAPASDPFERLRG